MLARAVKYQHATILELVKLVPPRIALHGMTNKLILVAYLPSCSNFLFYKSSHNVLQILEKEYRHASVDTFHHRY